MYVIVCGRCDAKAEVEKLHPPVMWSEVLKKTYGERQADDEVQSTHLCPECSHDAIKRVLSV